MATFTLSQCLDRANRDLTQSELAALEAVIVAAGIEAVLQGLSEICGLKAEHIVQAWQDTPLAKRWPTLEGALGVASTRATGLWRQRASAIVFAAKRLSHSLYVLNPNKRFRWRGRTRASMPAATFVPSSFKLLAKTAEERYQTAAGLERDLRHCVAACSCWN